MDLHESPLARIQFNLIQSRHAIIIYSFYEDEKKNRRQVVYVVVSVRIRTKQPMSECREKLQMQILQRLIGIFGESNELCDISFD